MSSSILSISVYVCWGLLVLIWLAGWLYNLVMGPATQKRSGGLPVWIIGGGLVYLLFRLGLFNAINLTSPFPLWLQLVGLVLLITSAFLTFWARLSLGTMWSDRPETKVGHQLHTDGPYQVTRHPIYTGIIGMLIGSLLIIGLGYWIFLIAMGIGIVLSKVPEEERLMINQFGDAYSQYRQTVPQILPGLQWLRKPPEDKKP